MKNIFSKLLTCILIINSAILCGMQKRPIEMAAESSQLTKKARIEAATSPAVSDAGKSYLELLPKDAQGIILEKLITTEPKTYAGLRNSIRNIRHMMATSRSLNALSLHQDINTLLIKKLAQHYNQSEMSAAITLHTRRAQAMIEATQNLAPNSFKPGCHDSIQAALYNAVQIGDSRALLFIGKHFEKHLPPILSPAFTPELTALITASIRGYLPIVKLLIQSGATVNAQNIYGETALWHAARNGRLEVAQLLLEQEKIIYDNFIRLRDSTPRPSRFEYPACRYTTRSLNLPAAPILSTRQQDTRYNYTPLMCAIEGSHVPLVRLLLPYEISLLNDPLMLAAQKGNLEIVELLLEAFQRKSLKGTSWINNPSSTGMTVLMHAVKGGHVSIVERLLTIQGIVINRANNLGQTTLDIARTADNPNKERIIQLLKKRGAKEKKL